LLIGFSAPLNAISEAAQETTICKKRTDLLTLRWASASPSGIETLQAFGGALALSHIIGLFGSIQALDDTLNVIRTRTGMLSILITRINARIQIGKTCSATVDILLARRLAGIPEYGGRTAIKTGAI